MRRTIGAGKALGLGIDDQIDAVLAPSRHLLLAMLAGRASPLHFDHVYMNRGTDRVVTTWIPLGDVTVADGPLAGAQLVQDPETGRLAERLEAGGDQLEQLGGHPGGAHGAVGGEERTRGT